MSRPPLPYIIEKKDGGDYERETKSFVLKQPAEDTISKHVKDSLQKTADILQKQCNSLKQQVKEVKEKICNKAGNIVDVAKRKGQKVLYKITQVTGMRKKRDAIKNNVNRAINSMESLEKAKGECLGQQEKGRQAETPLSCIAVAEPQPEYGAELFEKYQREHGKETIQAAEKTVMQEGGKADRKCRISGGYV